MNSKNKRRTILHVTPHLGGGVGTVILNYLRKVNDEPDFVHKVLSLDYANEKAVLASRTIGFSLTDRMSSRHDTVLAAIAEADIVLIHWWNHPLLYDFLVRETLPPARVIFWSHTLGYHAPSVFNETVLCYPDLFVFTSPLSLETPEVKRLREERQKSLRVIWSTGGIEHVASVRPKPHAGFTIGYIGTVDYCKMHPEFLGMSSLVKIPDARFIVCGGPSEKQITTESLKYDNGRRFSFTGHVENITDYLSEFDVFGYPLAPCHYGTCEQSLCESMAAGVPPVVLTNLTECHIVEDGVTGVVAANKEEYARALEQLYRNRDLRQRLSDNARKAAAGRFSIELMINRWEKVFHDALTLPKTERHWTGRCRGKSASPAQVFVEALGMHGNDFMSDLNTHDEAERKAARDAIRRLYASSHLWRSNTQGTPHHYHNCFPEDVNLKLWSSLDCHRRERQD